MDAYKIAIKLFAAADEFAPDQFVPIFHRWIQKQDFPDHLLIDVADYAHVQSGPGTVLIANEANMHMDRGENRLGLMYWRKTTLPGNFADRLKKVLIYAMAAAARLEKEESLAGRLKFRTDEILIRINDRLLAPNTPETFAAVKNDLQAAGKQIFGSSSFTVKQQDSPLRLFEVDLKSSDSPGLETLQIRLGV